MSGLSLKPVMCPCGSKKTYVACCGALHAGSPAASAEALMRSRYSAYALGLQAYIASSWHDSTRPHDIVDESVEPLQWLRLQVKHHTVIDDHHAQVEFVARYKVAGKAYRLHEISRFVREGGHWFYLDGEQP